MTQKGATVEFGEKVTYECPSPMRFGPDEDLHLEIYTICQQDGNFSDFKLKNGSSIGYDWPLCEDPSSKYFKIGGKKSQTKK